MNPFQSRAVRRTMGSALVGLALLAVVAVPTLAATPGADVTPLCNGKAATIVGAPGVAAIRGTQGADDIVTRAGDDRIDGCKDFDTCQAGGGSNYVGHCEA